MSDQRPTKGRALSPLLWVGMAFSVVCLVFGLIAGARDGQWGTAGLGLVLIGILLANPTVLRLAGRRRHQVGIALGVLIVGGSTLVILGSHRFLQIIPGWLLVALGLILIVVHSSSRVRNSSFWRRMLGPL